MEIIKKEFIEELSLLRQRSINNRKQEFNIFTVLHKKTAEQKLHSRFIASLLDPKGSHDQGDKFLKKFLDLLELRPYECIAGHKQSLESFDMDHIHVYPTQEDKIEMDNIDILIHDNSKAIVIENKIFAGDSNKKLDDGTYQAQLLNYHDQVQNKLNLHDGYAYEKITLVYLTINGRKPTLYYQFKSNKVNLKCIDYIQFIPAWLENCMVDLDKSHLRDCIRHYIDLVKLITNDFDLTMDLRKLIVQNMDEVYRALYSIPLENKLDQHFLEQEFKHIQWHTIHEFWHSLGNHIGLKYNVNVSIPKDSVITTTVHTKVNRIMVLDFNYSGNKIYISNDSKGFTWGIITPNQNKDWKEIQGLTACLFSDFHNETIFNMIDKENQEDVINTIITVIDLVLSRTNRSISYNVQMLK
ncbi:PD-(D/E)XK nuclease family protein [Sphingobacterium faecium]|uniref:PDDEXK-like family protein n=1 Tax=Sphingobacterium faecium TaxID=34087 RepID=UPI00320AB03C